MTEELRELEIFVRKAGNISNVSLLAETLQPGFRIIIDHGSSEFPEDGPPYFDRFPVTVRLSDQKKNWEAVLRTCLTVRKKILEEKRFKWVLGNIEREKSETEYVLLLNISVEHRY